MPAAAPVAPTVTPASVSAAVSAPMTTPARAMPASTRAMPAAVAGAVSRRPVDVPINVNVPIDMDITIDVDVPVHVKVAMVPAMPSGRAAPADSAIPRKATPVPACAAPARRVPAVIATAPDELRLFDGRAFDKGGRRRECANADRRFRGKDELGDHSGRRGKRQDELAKHEMHPPCGVIVEVLLERKMNGGAGRPIFVRGRARYRAGVHRAMALAGVEKPFV